MTGQHLCFVALFATIALLTVPRRRPKYDNHTGAAHDAAVYNPSRG
jgi:hypothetical protein